MALSDTELVILTQDNSASMRSYSSLHLTQNDWKLAYIWKKRHNRAMLKAVQSNKICKHLALRKKKVTILPLLFRTFIVLSA